MCPATLAIAAAAAAASAAGSLVGGISSANAAGYQAQIAGNNAKTARQNAAYSAQAGAAQTEQAGLKARANQANLRAGEAAEGVDANTGSAADVQTSERQLGLLDTQTVANRAAQQVYGYETQATSFQAQSRLDTAEEVPDLLGGTLKAGGSLISAAPDLPSSYGWMGGGGSSEGSGAMSDDDMGLGGGGGGGP